MRPEYVPTTLNECLAKLAEECSEVTKECMKAIRFGIDDFNPADPEKITNESRILRELKDIKLATQYLEMCIEQQRVQRKEDFKFFGTGVYEQGVRFCENYNDGQTEWKTND